MQTLQNFSVLTWQEQVNSIWIDGILLLNRRIPGYWLHLYAIGPFFAEMWICQKTYRIELVRAFTDLDELDPYLLQIRLAEIDN